MLPLVTELHSEPSSEANFITPALDEALVEPRLQPPGRVALPWWAFSSSTDALSPFPRQKNKSHIM